MLTYAPSHIGKITCFLPISNIHRLNIEKIANVKDVSALLDEKPSRMSPGNELKRYKVLTYIKCFKQISIK